MLAAVEDAVAGSVYKDGQIQGRSRRQLVTASEHKEADIMNMTRYNMSCSRKCGLGAR